MLGDSNLSKEAIEDMREHIRRLAQVKSGVWITETARFALLGPREQESDAGRTASALIQLEMQPSQLPEKSPSFIERWAKQRTLQFAESARSAFAVASGALWLPANASIDPRLQQRA